jgi:SAM-dependent methyltransferase
MSQPQLDSERAQLFARYTQDFYGFQNDLSAEGIEKLVRYAGQALVPLLPPDRQAPILEVGTGGGGFLVAARRAGYTAVSGLDVSSQQVDFCRQLGFADVECVSGVDYLSRPGRAFAAIVMADVLEHLTKAEALAIPQLTFQRLVPGGRFIVRVPNMSNPLNVRTRYADLTHEVGFTLESLAQLLRNADFEVDQVRGEYALHPRWFVRLVFDRLLWAAFKVFARRTLHLPFPIERGKNLIAVGIRPAAIAPGPTPT